ncbi:MAG: hypothetical protein RLZZ436_3937 [Planctomycetota bacterium]|jgi:hypothetical protein
MLRKSLVALLLGVIGAGGIQADDTPVRQKSSTGIVGWLKGRSDSDKATKAQPGNGVERAVVRDAEKQSVVRRTSAGQQDQKTSRPQATTAAKPVSRPAAVQQAEVAPPPTPDPGVSAAPSYGTPGMVQPGYPQTGAALYPAPVPGIPHQMGGTVIMNPALQPHEMLYGHQYKALYPPYYYQVHGEWLVTPFGVWSQENWKLKGTEVNVRYRTSISPFSFFTPPALR